MKKKILATLVCLAAVILALGIYFYLAFRPAPEVNFGITFSNRYAQYLGFDPKEVYLDILADLKPKKIRLMAYWEDIEPVQGQFKFTDLDLLLIEAGKRGVGIVLVVGLKQPRWPECHSPDWYNQLDPNLKQEAELAMVRTAVGHFKQFSAIESWQVENEPYFVFGQDCPARSPDLVSNEIQVIKKIDNRPIMLTDSGEMGNWERTAKLGADILGVTMYRTVHSKLFGYYKYPLPPLFYRIKSGIFEKFSGNKPIVGIELQAEPWFIAGVFGTDLDTQKALMNPKIFADNIAYARKVGFADNYLWGAEWWYWMAKQQNDWGMWTAAKDLISK